MMNGIIEFWEGLPTWGKVGIVALGVGIVVFIVKQKPDTSQTKQLIVQPDNKAGIPYGSPLGGGGSGGGLGNGNGGGNSGGNGTGTGGQSGGNGGGSNSGGTTPFPATPGGGATPPPVKQVPVIVPKPSLPQVHNVKPGATIQRINEYVAQNRSTISDQQMTSLHNSKVVAASKINVHVDDWGQAKNSDGSFNDKFSAKFQTVSDVNGYVAQKGGSLQQDQMNSLHAQKVALAQKQGHYVTDDGHVFDMWGKPIGQNGMG